MLAHKLDTRYTFEEFDLNIPSGGPSENGIKKSQVWWTLGGLTFNGEILKVKNLMGAPSNPIPLVKRSSEQFLFLKLDIWKALM